MHRSIWRRFRWLIIASGVVLAVIVAAGVFLLVNKPGNISNPQVSFHAPKPKRGQARHNKLKPTAVPKPPPDNFRWRMYGYNPRRTRDFVGADADLHPPFKTGWTLGGNGPIEFPPTMYAHTLFFMDDNGAVNKVAALTGKRIWRKRVGTLSAASPALDVKHRLLIVPVLSDSGSAPGDGRVVAMSMKTGHIIWSKSLPAGSESQPLISQGTVYLGDQGGTVYALNELTGAERWTYQAASSVKGGLALDHGMLFFGDYSGHAYAISKKTGKLIWDVGTDGTEFGLGSGTFYATPVVAFGRVYMGNTDGFVYSFAEKNGALAWRTGTGAYVYASAAVADTPGLGPTVYVGSYNGYFYALDARTGAIRWSHDDGDRISGAATIVNNIVYYADLDDARTTGLNARTGAVEFTFHDGAYSSVMGDPQTLFLPGHYVLYELLPMTHTGAGGHRADARRRAAHKRRANARHRGAHKRAH